MAVLLAGAACVAAATAFTGTATAVEPPDLVNYEGVLRDPNGVPRNGAFDMTFRFFDALTLGNEILVDSHLAAGTGAVTVTGGLFNVKLGGGGVGDGSAVLPNDPYTSLTQVFRDFSPVWLEVQVGGETLAPRIEVVSAAYALNSDNLDGKDASAFIDTSATAQIKAGDLTVDDMQVGGGLDVGGQVTIQGGTPGAGRVLTSSPAGLATWQDLPAAQVNTLRGLADRLHASDPSDLPFATLRSFDCSGVKTATIFFIIGASSQGTVTGFVGADRISDTSEYLIAVERNDTALNTESLIGQDGRIILQRDGAMTFFSGMVTEAGLAAWDGSTATYVFRLEPHLITMARNSGYQVFLERKASEIIDQLLGEAGLPAADVESTVYQYDFAIRWEETPLNFFNRLAESEGIHYHFREGVAKEELVIRTSGGGFTPTPPPGSFNYYGDLQDPGTGEEFVATFHSRTRHFSGDGRAAGWDYGNKEAVVETATVPGGAGELQEFFADAGVFELAQLRADAIVAREQVRRFEHSGTGNVAHLKAGHSFTLTDLTTAGFGGSYVVTGIRHYAVGDPAQSCVSYGNAFTAIPSTVAYSPPRRSHPPNVRGPIRAIVTDVQDPDRLGRVKIKYPLDPNGFVESDWARVAVPSWRQDTRIFVPDVEDEVLVDFVRNDPMVPVVVGSLYNGVDPPNNFWHNEIFMANYFPERSCYNSTDPNEVCRQSINFFDDNDPKGEVFSWEDAPDRFELTNDLWVVGDLGSGGQLNVGGAMIAGGQLTIGGGMDAVGSITLGGNLDAAGSMTLGGGSLRMDNDGPDSKQFLYFYDANSPTDEYLSWNDAADTFELTDDLKLSGALEAAGPLTGTSLDVGTGTISGDTLLDMGSGLILGGQLNVGSGLILGGSVLASSTVQGATLSATGAIQGATTLTLPGPISLNGADLSQSGGLFSLAGGLSVSGDADLTGDLTVGGGDITAGTLNIAPTSQLLLSGTTISLSSNNTLVGSKGVVSNMIDSDNNSGAMTAGWYHDGSLANTKKLADLSEFGNLRVRGSLTPFVSFDIAESFLAGEPVEPGDLVRLDPATPGAVRLTERAADPLVIGVVSGNPGIVLGGGSFDEAALWAAWGDEVGGLYEADRTRLREEVLAEHGDLRRDLAAIEPVRSASGIGDGRGALAPDGGLVDDGSAEKRTTARRAIEDRIEANSLERFYAERFAPVALAGRVPVKVDASYGAIEPGDALTPSPVPGVAMKAAGPGPIIGTALEGLAQGRGKILTFIHRDRHSSPPEPPLAEAGAIVRPAQVEPPIRDEVGGARAAPQRVEPVIDDSAPFRIHRVDGGSRSTETEVLRVDTAGNVYARGAFHPASMDLAEYFPLSERAEAGDLLVVDPDKPGRYGLARRTGDPAVVGIVSAGPGVLLGSGISSIASADEDMTVELEEARRLGDDKREEEIWAALKMRFEETHAPVALSGTVLCKVDAAYGSIVPGDLLTTSPTPGHAMRADDPAPGTIVGKALEPLGDGTGRIKVLVMMR
jgi:type VI secretion system VgrG family protein